MKTFERNSTLLFRPFAAMLILLGAAPGAGATAPTQAAGIDAGRVPGHPPRRIDHTRMHYDRPGDGSLWARGANYKARFDAQGPTYYPLLGPRAPRHLPVTFRLESITAATSAIAFEARAEPALEGDRITYARGSVLEVYEMAPEAMEQEFVLEHLPDRGDLVIRVGISSELAARESEGGLELSGEHGSVRYGRATAVDAQGARSPCITTLAGGAIEIRVPQAFLASAVLPLTIDPVVSTFTVFDGIATASDVAYDASTDRYLVVFNEISGPGDGDVYAVQTDSTGSVTAEGYVDLTASDWTEPAVANNAEEDQFLVVAQVSPNGLPDFNIRGRTVVAGTHSMSSAFTISGGEAGSHLRPDVGGDPFTGTAYYCVVWGFGPAAAGAGEIHMRLVRTDGTLVGAGSTVLDEGLEVSVSKSNDEADWWVVWNKYIGPGDYEIWGALIRWNGNISVPPFAIAVNLVDPTVIPIVSSPLDGTSKAIVTSHYDFGPDDDILVWLIDETGSLDLTNLSYQEDLDGSGGLFRNQAFPSADSDGNCFVVAYHESTGDAGAGNYDTYYATLTSFGNELGLSESHQQLSSSAGDEMFVALTSTEGSGGAARRFMIVWQDDTGGLDIEGALCDCSQYTIYCSPGYTILPCPCQNPPNGFGKGCNNSSNTGGASVSGSGVASVQQDSLVFTTAGEKPTALSIFLQGNVVIQSGTVFGQGVRCVGGTLRRLYVKSASNGVAIAPQNGDPPVHVRSAMLGDPFTAGDTRHYMVYYRDPIVLGGCPPTSTFNGTQALQAHWLP